MNAYFAFFCSVDFCVRRLKATGAKIRRPKFLGKSNPIKIVKKMKIATAIAALSMTGLLHGATLRFDSISNGEGRINNESLYVWEFDIEDLGGFRGRDEAYFVITPTSRSPEYYLENLSQTKFMISMVGSPDLYISYLDMDILSLDEDDSGDLTGGIRVKPDRLIRFMALAGGEEVRFGIERPSWFEGPAAFVVERPSAMPEPSVALLSILGSITLLRRRR